MEIENFTTANRTRKEIINNNMCAKQHFTILLFFFFFFQKPLNPLLRGSTKMATRDDAESLSYRLRPRKKK